MPKFRVFEPVDCGVFLENDVDGYVSINVLHDGHVWHLLELWSDGRLFLCNGLETCDCIQSDSSGHIKVVR